MTNPLVKDVLQRYPRCKEGECRHCDRADMVVLPLRYDAFCSDDARAMEAIAELPPQLGAGVAGIPLSGPRYVPRLLREAWLYVLVQRPGLTSWQAYYVRPDAILVEFPAAVPPPRATGEPGCRRMAESGYAMTVKLERPEEIEQTWWLFTPDPLSEAKLDEYRANADAYAAMGRLQTFSPQRWLQGERGLAHTLDAEALAEAVPEFAVVGRPPGMPASAPAPFALAGALERQAWPPLRDAMAEPDPAGSLLGWHRPRLQKAQDVLADGPAFVLHDPLGITQALNAWRNVAWEGMQPWLQAEDEHGISNEWKWLVASELRQVHEGIRQHRVEMAETRAERRRREEAEHALRGFRDPRIKWMMGEAAAEGIRTAIEDAHVSDPLGVHAQRRARARQHAEASMERYAALLDGSHQAILDGFEVRAAECEPTVAERVDDHLAWLRSDALQHALHAYDRDDFRRGWAFVVQASLAMLGMEGTEAGRAQLAAWWADESAPEDNLAWRTYALNQERLLQGARAALAEMAATPASTDWHTLAIDATATGRDLIATFALADVALAEVEMAGRVPWFRGSWMGLMMGWYAQFGRALFGALAPGRITRGTGTALTRLLQARMGRLATELRFEELHAATEKLSITRVRSQLNRRIREAVEREIEAGPKGQGYRLRLVTALATLESAHLLLKASDVERIDSQVAAELAAAGLAVMGGSLQLITVAGEWVGRGFSPRTQTARAAAIWTGGMGLTGGFLMGTAGIVMAWVDWGRGNEAFGQDRHGLGYAYLARAVAVASATAFGTTATFAASGPFLQMMAKRTTISFFRTAFETGARFTIYLSARQSLMLFLRVVGPKLGWAAFGVSALLWLLTPDAFEKWCERSAFRLDKSKKGYADMGGELSELQVAFREATI